MNGALDTGENRLLFLLELILVNENGHGVDAGRHVLEGDAILFKYLKNLSPKPNFGVHHCLVDVHSAEALLSGNTGDGVVRTLAGVLDDHGTRIFRTVRVADIDRDSGFSYREDRVLMKDTCTHVGELTELGVGDGLDRSRILNNSRICYEETGNICPVLVKVRLDRTCHDGTCDIGTTAGEGVDRSVRLSTVEARNDCLL